MVSDSIRTQKNGKPIGYLLKNIINIYNFLILCRSVTNKRTNNVWNLMRKRENRLNARVLLIGISLGLICLPSCAVVVPLLSNSHIAWYLIDTLYELHRETFTYMPSDMAVNHLQISLIFLKDLPKFLDCRVGSQ